MPTEKKKVNLVNLKTKFSVFLHNYYCCQICFSIDKLAFGFTCEHKFCSKCNNNYTDQCKECKAEIENLATNDGLFPCLENLKEVMGIDMNKVANKLKQFNTKVTNKTNKEDKVDVNEKIDTKKNDNQSNENNQIESDVKDKSEQNENSEHRSENDNKLASSRSSKRQVTKKANESRKNNSSIKTDAQPEKISKRISNIGKPKNLQDYVEDCIKDNPELKEIKKVTSKSPRKSNKLSKSTKSSLVIISTSITENELKILNKFAKKFNAKIVNDYSDEITHLVTLETKPNSRLTTRTLKYLKSLLSHKWLLDFKWIKESLANDKLVDESDYELLGITKQSDGNLGAPKRSRESQNVKLFEGKRFYIDGKFGPKCGLPKDDYKELIKVGGGDVIESEKDVQDDTYIIIEVTYLNKSKYKGRPNSLSTTDFLNCVSDFRFDL